MSKIGIFIGKDLNEALDQGCLELGVTREEIEYEVLEWPEKKLFKKVPAKVRITVREDEFSVRDLLAGIGGSETEAKPKQEEKPVKKVEKKPVPKKENKKQPENAPEKEAPAVVEEKAAAAEPAEEKKEEKKPSSSNNKKKKKKNPNKPAPEKKEEAEKTENPETAPAEDGSEAPDTASEILGYLTEEELPARALNALNYLRQIVAALGYEKIEYTFGKTEKGVRFILGGEDAPSLIGRRGEVMDSLQYLCTVGSSRENGDYCRISLDIEGYRARREEALIELAKKTAAKVKKNHRSQTLEPMNPYERRIVHAAIQNIEGVSSHSVGSEPYRKVVVSLEGADDRRNRGHKGGKKSGSPRPKNTSESSENVKTEKTETERKAPIPVKKELKSQEEFVGALYGKIEL